MRIRCGLALCVMLAISLGRIHQEKQDLIISLSQLNLRVSEVLELHNLVFFYLKFTKLCRPLKFFEKAI